MSSAFGVPLRSAQIPKEGEASGITDFEEVLLSVQMQQISQLWRTSRPCRPSIPRIWHMCLRNVMSHRV